MASFIVQNFKKKKKKKKKIKVDPELWGRAIFGLKIVYLP